MPVGGISSFVFNHSNAVKSGLLQLGSEEIGNGFQKGSSDLGLVGVKTVTMVSAFNGYQQTAFRYTLDGIHLGLGFGGGNNVLGSAMEDEEIALEVFDIVQWIRSQCFVEPLQAGHLLLSKGCDHLGRSFSLGCLIQGCKGIFAAEEALE